MTGSRSTRLTVVAVAALLALSACSEEDDLSGSLTDFYDVSFDTVRARLYPNEFAIEYLRTNGQVPVRVTLVVDEEAPIHAGKFNLMEAGNITGRSDDVDIPDMVSGKITLETYEPTQGGAVKGNFEASFLTGKDTTSLKGVFDTAIEVVDHPGGYIITGYPRGDSCADPLDGHYGGVFTGKIADVFADSLLGGMPPFAYQPYTDADGNEVTPPEPDLSCSEGLDRVILIEAPVAGDALVTLEFTGDVKAGLYFGECGQGELVACLAEDGEQTVALAEAGSYYIVVEGTDGSYSIGIDLPNPPIN